MWEKTLLFFFCAMLIGVAVLRAEDNADYNEKKIAAMQAMRNISFTKPERWTIFFNLCGNSFGTYDERAFKFEIIKPLVEANDIDALVVYAEEASSGSGLPEDKKQNIPKGNQFYERAAELGDIESMNNVAWYYLRGVTDIKPDERKALKWFIRYDLYHPRIETREIISKLYSGINPHLHREANVSPDKQKAREWKQKAVELKNKTGNRPPEEEKSSWHLIYEKKKKLTKGAGDGNAIMERFWAYQFQEYMQKIQNGDARTARDLGFIFENGFFSFRKDITHAIKFYQRAANLGDNYSKGKVGKLLISEKSSFKDLHAGLRLLHDAYRNEPNYYQRMRILDQIIKAYQYGPVEIRNARLAEKWNKRKKAEKERVNKGGLKMVDKKWDESTETDEYYRDRNINNETKRRRIFNCTDRDGSNIITDNPHEGMKNCVLLGYD